MPVTHYRRNEYSRQYHFRLLNDEAEQLEQILARHKITLVDFIRKAIKENQEPPN